MVTSMMCRYNSDTNDVGGTNTGFITPLGVETQDGQRLGSQEPVLNRMGVQGQVKYYCSAKRTQQQITPNDLPRDQHLAQPSSVKLLVAVDGN